MTILKMKSKYIKNEINILKMKNKYIKNKN